MRDTVIRAALSARTGCAARPHVRRAGAADEPLRECAASRVTAPSAPLPMSAVMSTPSSPASLHAAGGTVGMIRTIAPEVEESELRADVSLREQVDLDSMDWLNVIVGFHERFRVEIPEADHAKLGHVERHRGLPECEGRQRLQRRVGGECAVRASSARRQRYCGSVGNCRISSERRRDSARLISRRPAWRRSPCIACVSSVERVSR